MGGINEKSLGLRLQDARRSAGLTQQELCQKSGLSYSTLAKIERGAIKSPSIFTIQQIAGALNVGIDEIIGPVTPPEVIQHKKTSKSGISFIYFDINGCLVGFYHRAFKKISVDLNLPLEKVETACWHYNNAVCKGEISIDEYNTELANAFGVETFDWADYYLDSIDPIPEARDLLIWASEHYKVGLLSNIMPGLIDHMLARDLLPNIDYDVIIDSSKVGYIKPEPEIFAVATEKADVQPSEILLIDDSRSNLMTAASEGWRTAWFDDFRPGDSCDNVKQILEF